MSIEKLLTTLTEAVEANTEALLKVVSNQEKVLAKVATAVEDATDEDEDEKPTRSSRRKSTATKDEKPARSSRRGRTTKEAEPEESDEDEDGEEDEDEKPTRSSRRGRKTEEKPTRSSRRGRKTKDEDEDEDEGEEDADEDEDEDEDEKPTRRSRSTTKKPAAKKPAAKKSTSKTKKLTHADVRARFAEFMEDDDKEVEEERREFVEAILDHLGADKTSDIEEEDFEDVLGWLDDKEAGKKVRFD